MDDKGKSINDGSRSPIEVIVASLPEPKTKRFWRDSSLLLSLSAFLFSAASGGYATYQSWLSYREVRLNQISALIEKYYDLSGKVSSAKDQFIIGLLRAQQQHAALDLYRRATAIEGLLDDANWNAIGQIEAQQGFPRYAMDASTFVVKREDKSYDYLYALRSLGYEQLVLGLEKEGTETINKAVSTALAAGDKKLPLADTILKKEAGWAYTNWLEVKGPTADCRQFIFYYDGADQALTDFESLASSGPLSNDAGVLRTTLDRH